MKESGHICSGDCHSCPFYPVEKLERPAKDIIRIAVAGLPEAGADTLAAALEGDGCCLSPFRYHREQAGDADIIVQVADSMHLERDFLETTYLMDTGVRIVLVLGNYDALVATGHSVDCDTLSMILGFPVLTSRNSVPQVVSAIRSIQSNALWLPKTIQGRSVDEEDHARRGFVAGALQETLRHSRDNSDHSLAQKVDALLTSRWLGLPLLVIVLFLVFAGTFALGAYPQQWIENGVDALSRAVSSSIRIPWLSSLLSDGIVQGVGAVVSFLPNIIILFFFLSLLEDSGYMSRAAYVMDKMMHRIGLHGNSFIPMLIGFGCNVPAIMAAKNIQNPKDRALTMLMIPFMSCSARLPVYMLLVSAFFPRCKALVMISIYILGIAVSIVFAFVMKRTRWFRKGAEDYVSELPPFHLPRLKATASHIWERVADYLQKISTVILAASVIIWALEYFPTTDGQRAASDESCLAAIGQAMDPVMAPLGFDWKMNVCILTGLPAKEAIVSTLGILYHTEDNGSLIGAMHSEGVFSPAVALAFMVFVLLYFPCLATISTLRREVGGKWAAFTVVNSLALAWTLAFVVLRIASLLL